MDTKYNESTVEKDITNLAEQVGFVLDDTQLHIGGERAIMSPDKYVLTGTLAETGQSAILKCSNRPAGITEIEEEHTIRDSLTGLTFTEQELIAPTELFFGQVDGYTVSITAHIPQDKVFTDHSLQDQFFMALYALECQESFHATTREHKQPLRAAFKHHTPDFYLTSYQEYQQTVTTAWEAAAPALQTGYDLLQKHRTLLIAYDGYLIHSDFVPHNFRIQDRQLYLLDFVSFRLANKYESWARLINWMEVHNAELVEPLMSYVKTDRGATEYLVLRLLRIYKISFLLNYYAATLMKTEGDLKALTASRLKFWTHVLHCVIADTPVDQTERSRYHADRIKLRTDTEKARQRQFTWAK